MLGWISEAAAWASRRNRLTYESWHGQIGLQNFQGHVPAERDLFGQIDFGHGPPSQPAEQAVASQLPARQIAGATGITSEGSGLLMTRSALQG